MKKYNQFISGFIVAAIIFSLTPVFSDSIDAIFNSINITMNGVTVADQGEGYILDDGTTVPYSILYKGTTYLPIREIGNITGKNITWDGNTRTAGINDPNYVDKSNIPTDEIVDFRDYKGLFYRINGEGTYIGDMYNNTSVRSIISQNNKYYLSLHALLYVLEPIEGKSDIIESDNPFVDGAISYTTLDSRSYEAEHELVYTSPTETYHKYLFYKKDNPQKIYEVSMKEDSNNVLFHNGSGYIDADDALGFFGVSDYFDVTIDNRDMYIYIEITTK